MSRKNRLDLLLVDRGLAENQSKAKALILAGDVLVDGSNHLKPGQQVSNSVSVEIREPLKYVSRGGLKLEKALEVFDLHISGKVAIDVGSSTGGFTDCLLQNGVKLVHSIDVGYGQLAWKLRKDKRVVVAERIDVRKFDVALLEMPVEIATIDVSFISLKKVIPAVLNLIEPQSDIVALIKPQFEATRQQVQKGGVIRSAEVHAEVIDGIVKFATEKKLAVMGVTFSPIRGPAGNIEFFIWLRSGEGISELERKIEIDRLVRQAHEESR